MRRGPGLRSDPRPGKGISDRHQAISKASEAQRDKIDGRPCIACGKVAPFVPVDPAHLAARGFRGGCNDPLCVVPLCRWCHRDFDDRRLDGGLLGYLLRDRLIAEIEHALGHYRGDLVALLERLECATVTVTPVFDKGERG